ncbi:hypothetical protein HQ865_19830 [Mucilaginibacter mali]|uniref:DUF4412 domain-containing protein n=1 Tax=Mucilaginibacter mali TaxID=2740462 RepID=A0A7D4UEM3_9SPHI|nr:hypothetical protein [Mucilaginibacter mali]QKJ31919.1 hypothetical protein HQ865_19830 [Mucilaginibacter mali]
MKKVFLLMAVCAVMLSACSDKKKEGVITYQLSYQLPDSLTSFAAYLPKHAHAYFKGDSVASVQGTDEESTTMITYHPTGYLLCLLKSGMKRFQVQYSLEEQKKELPDMSLYEFTRGRTDLKIAGYAAQQYIMKNKFSGDTTSAWFTHDIEVPPNYLTAMFKPEFGTPLRFSINQNGMVTETSFKEIRYEPVPAGIFVAPPGYKKMTPSELNEMPVGN